jgi:uncharacterized protein YjbI with pentapeptide repeats
MSTGPTGGGGSSRRPDWRKNVTPAVSILSVLLVAVGLILTAAANRDTNNANLAQQRLTEQGQVTDRFGRAIDQLGSRKRDVRLGGIYSLERLMHDSPPDEPNIIEVLSAYIRDNTHLSAAAALVGSTSAPAPSYPTDVHPKTDVAAALTVLGRRPDPASHRHVLLAKADITGASLPSANLTGADLRAADLTHAFLTRASLPDASLRWANLTSANLTSANLTSAHLPDTDLTGADLTGANLTGANLTGANLTDANLTRARWPLHISVPPGWVRNPDSGLLKRAGRSGQ